MEGTSRSTTVLLAAGIFAAWVLYGATIAIYRLIFHPLARYPGPFLVRITSWYDCYHAYMGDRHLDQLACHERYGPIIRYAPNYVLFNTAAGLRAIYGGSKNAPVRKGPAYGFLHDHGVTSTHSVIDKDIHGRKRRVLSHAFSDNALRALEDHVIENISRWCDAMADKASEKTTDWSSAKNMSVWANYLTFDVLGDLCFGKPFGLLTSNAQRYIPRLMMSRSKAFHIVANSPMLPWWKLIHEKLALDKYFTPQIYQDTQTFQKFAHRSMNERLEMAEVEEKENTKVRKDFFYWLTRAKDPLTGEGYSTSEMWLESILLITAGSDTSSVTTAAAFHYLVRNPMALAKLQAELRSTFTSVDEICTPKVNSCHYLRAVIDETLRLTPPVPSSLQREITQATQVDGHFLPAGALVGTSAWAIHRSPLYYDEPKTFRPERWIVDESAGVTADDVARARSAFCPFSLGMRGCIGKPMAYTELSIALGRVLHRFDIRLKEGDHTGEGKEGEFVLKDQFVSERDGPYVEFQEPLGAIG